MKFLDKIKKWPIEKKRIFSISLAIIITILIIILNSISNSLWKDEIRNINLEKNNPINSLQESFSQIFNEVKPILDQAFSSSTHNMATQTEEIIEQNNSTSSSFSTTSNIVE